MRGTTRGSNEIGPIRTLRSRTVLAASRSVCACDGARSSLLQRQRCERAAQLRQLRLADVMGVHLQDLSVDSEFHIGFAFRQGNEWVDDMNEARKLRAIAAGCMFPSALRWRWPASPSPAAIDRERRP